MTDEEYAARVDECCAAAGAADEGWNRRFMQALAARGLRLASVRDGVTTPRAIYVMAPMPYEDSAPQWPESWIIEDQGA